MKVTIMDPLLKSIANGMVDGTLKRALVEGCYDKTSVAVLNHSTPAHAAGVKKDGEEEEWETFVCLVQWAWGDDGESTLASVWQRWTNDGSADGLHGLVEEVIVERLAPGLSFDRRAELMRMLCEMSEEVADQVRLETLGRCGFVLLIQDSRLALTRSKQSLPISREIQALLSTSSLISVREPRLRQGRKRKNLLRRGSDFPSRVSWSLLMRMLTKSPFQT